MMLSSPLSLLLAFPRSLILCRSLGSFCSPSLDQTHASVNVHDLDALTAFITKCCSSTQGTAYTFFTQSDASNAHALVAILEQVRL
jgi:cytochrome c2